jgi:small-conductance mechanosensitive channel
LSRRNLVLFLAAVAWGGLAAAQHPETPPGGTGGTPPPRAAAPQSPAAVPAVPLSPAQVMAHLNRTIDWYNELSAIEQVPEFADDVIGRERIQQSSLAALQLAFTFGPAAAAVLSAPANGASPNGATQDTAHSLDAAAARVAERISVLQAQLSALEERMRQAPAHEQATLRAQHDELLAALNLAREVQSTVQDLLRFQTSSASRGEQGVTGLAAQVRDLERSVPEANRGALPGAESSAGAAAAPSSTPAAPAIAATSRSAAQSVNGFRPESAGIFALVGQWFALEGGRRQLSDALKSTDTLLKNLDGMRDALAGQARTLAESGIDVAPGTDPAQLLAAKASLEAAAARFKQLSSLLIPLGEQAMMVDSSRGTLTKWSVGMRSRTASVERYLLLRTAVLLASVLVVFVVSEIWRRATFRYLGDTRRRRQFLALRRVVVAIALGLIVVFALMSELGSLATYAGLITAGLAVALQNVILAVVGYFYLIGRHGVRVGDRITLAGVTGRVVDIGLIRIYLMELSGPELRSTGRMVVLSNAVLFQPTALFKQIPGADYLWHSLALTLEPSVDVQAAQERIQSAVNEVYEKYRSAIESQHALMQRSVDFETSMPRPEVQVRWSGSGLQFSVRYPVEGAQAVTIDQHMIRAVRAVLEKEPKLPFAPSGEPTVKSAD